MPAYAEALHPWHDFYILLGTASATLVGLLFVAASVSSGVFSIERRAPLRVFLTATLVNFSLILATSLLVLAPLPNRLWLSGFVLACAAFGLAHSALAWRDTLRDGLLANIDLEDRSWYLALPILGYLCLGGGGIGLLFGWHGGPLLLAISAGILLVTGVHNAWDITVWIVTRRRE